MQVKYLLLFRLMLFELLLLDALSAQQVIALAWPVWSVVLGYPAWLLAFYLYSRRGPRPLLTAASFAVDVGVTSLVLLGTGQLAGEFYGLYVLIILMSCFFQEVPRRFWLGTLVCLAYAYLSFPGYQTWADPFYFMRLSVLLSAVFFSTYITEAMAQIEKETADRFQEQVAWLARLSTVGRAVSGMLHEMRTPLNTIVLNVDYIISLLGKRKPRISEAEAELKIIRAEVDRTLAIVTNFLEFSMPKDLVLEPIELTEPIRATLETLKRHFHELNIEVKTDLRQAKVAGSGRHLVQLFTNLFMNAIQAMPSGGVLGVVSEVQGKDVIVTIRDDGIGMSSEELRKLFKPFSTNHPERGHGLGLAIAKWIAERHGGSLTLLSDGIKKGAQARITLPLTRT